MIMEKVPHLNAKTVFKLLQAGTISATDLTQACRSKLKQYTHLNPFITTTDKLAKEQAIASASRYAKKQPLSELDGIPIAIKDNFCTAGIQTTCASRMLEKFVPTYDATVYERLRAGGAVLMGKSNLDQFAMGSGTADSIYGPSRNLWGYKNDKEFRISGGSSGGSALGVLTGACFVGIGSDTGGSTRNPASYCGLVGLKPTYGLVSRHGLIPLVNSMDVPGILTRSVDDCVTVLNVIAGHDPKDSTTLTKPYRKIRLPPASKMTIKNVKIGIPVEYYNEHLSKEVLDTWNDIAKLLESEGASVEQVSLPHTEYSIVCYSILNQCEVASNMAKYDGIEFGLRADINDSTERLYAESRSQGFNEVVRNRILTGNYFLLQRNYEKYFNQALRVRRLIADDFDRAWEKVQILLTPTTLTTAPIYSDFITRTNRDQCAVQDFCTQPANMAGVPAVNIPIRLSPTDALPISLQLIGRNCSEPQLLAVAKYIEEKVRFVGPHGKIDDEFKL